MLTKQFFNSVRNSLFRGELLGKQIEGLNALCTAWVNDGGAIISKSFAYLLATAFHETAFTMQPIEEYGKGRGYRYGQSVNGNTYYGRGYVQLTWDYNYKKLGEKLGCDLFNKPELALDANIAAQIAIKGMKEGLFTGVNFDKCKGDFVKMRKIINGTDKAKQIARYAELFFIALQLNNATDDEVKASISIEEKKITNVNNVTASTGAIVVTGGGAGAVTNSSVVITNIQSSPFMALIVGVLIGFSVVGALWLARKYKRKILENVQAMEGAKND